MNVSILVTNAVTQLAPESTLRPSSSSRRISIAGICYHQVPFSSTGPDNPAGVQDQNESLATQCCGIKPDRGDCSHVRLFTHENAVAFYGERAPEVLERHRGIYGTDLIERHERLRFELKTRFR